MINFLSSWVKNLSLALIVVSILEMILPNNKTKKYVKMVMGLYILFSIIAPFINENSINLNSISIDTYLENINTEETSSSINQESMDKKLDEIYKKELQKDIINKIENLGYEVENCKVIAHISKETSGIEKIQLKIKGKTETENKETIENKIVSEIQKIQKVEIKNSEENEENSNPSITKTDFKIITDFLINEYGVDKECLKIS